MSAKAEAWLSAHLDPVPLTGESVDFDLSSYRSRVTREMLQARLRETPRAFGVGEALLAANVDAAARTLRVDAAGLMAANAEVGRRLGAGPAGAVDALRRLRAAGIALDAVAGRVGAITGRGERPSHGALVAYLEASARDQALGALKFCLPQDLRSRLAPWFADDAVLLDALLSPDATSLWSQLRAREVSLASARLREPPRAYAARLRRHRRQFGYLYGEDVEFEGQESVAALDARIAALGHGGAITFADLRRQMRTASQADRGRKLAARKRFAERLADGAGGETAARLTSYVMLARALGAHEDQNRRRKMRLLRDLRDLAQTAGLDLAHAGLRDFTGACALSSGGKPVLASTGG